MYKTLRAGKAVSEPKYLSVLNPLLDIAGLIRVGGRLQQADLPYEQQHPVILHRKSIYTKLLVRDLHITSCHAGTSTLLSLLAENYFIVGARHLVKAISHHCLKCQRAYMQTASQQMGNLPDARVNPSPPFSVTGIDFAGPFTVKRGNPRKPTKLKAYVCLFVCFATKCTHLELCSELSTDSFMAALNRFVSRRGLPTDIWTDNSRNFVGATRELSECFDLLATKKLHDSASHLTSRQRICWHFSPARAPHFGGIWEEGVK